MSIICTEAENSQYFNKDHQKGVSGCVWATIDPSTTHQLPFPRDYKYFSCLLNRRYALWADRIQMFKVRPDDIWTLGFGKTELTVMLKYHTKDQEAQFDIIVGTTWVRNIVHQLKIKNLDFTAEYVQIDSGYLEAPGTLEKINGDEEFNKLIDYLEKAIDELDAAPSPRMVKTHLPAYLLPKELWTIQPKIIYTSRDVKDVAVSLFHMYQNHSVCYKGSKEEFFDAFLNDFCIFGPFYEHISSFHQLRHFKNILFLTYEELNTNTFECVKRVSEFLNCSYSDDQLRQLIEHVSFGKMQDKIIMPANNSDFKFCRKGKIGGYRDDMSEDYIKRFDEWTAKKKKELNLN